MSHPRGTIPVRIARHRALALAKWLSAVTIPEGTILGDAGIPADEIEARDQRNQSALDALRAVLSGKSRGRPRGSVGTYYLPVAGLILLNDWNAVLTVPRRIRPLVWHIHAQMRRKHRPLVSADLRRRNIANGTHTPETVRKYQRELLRRRASKGLGLFAYKPDDPAGRRSTVLNPLPLMILPQFFQK